MTDETEPQVFAYDPTPIDTELPPAGATPMWMYVGEFKVGCKVSCIPVVSVQDGEGHGFIAPTGEPTAGTVIDG